MNQAQTHFSNFIFFIEPNLPPFFKLTSFPKSKFLCLIWLFLLVTTDVDGQFEISMAIFKYQTLIDEYQKSQKLAPKASVFYDKVSNVTIWGNHSTTQVPDFLNARINGLPVKEVLNNVNWSEEEFTKKVQKVREVKCLSRSGEDPSGASTAFSIVDAIRSLVTPTPKAIGFLLE
ncbi:hypothetical protein RHMOL_Rhmol10G0214300 [Rhododendron molle]|uniref:Uncharacterized protein n=1 Tax=Rhododendron molle TaxID=49168 RepID=A0ACC0M6I3_RHOML|nr:hypothetical protein RHMOL_Rhmol10G0214300 [Rhododendron molle]